MNDSDADSYDEKLVEFQRSEQLENQLPVEINYSNRSEKVKVSQSVHSMSKWFQTLLELDDEDKESLEINLPQFSVDEIANEIHRITEIQRLVAKHGQIKWNQLLEKLKNADSNMIFNGQEFENEMNFRNYIEDRPFLFKDWDRFYGPANQDYHNYILVQYFAKVLLCENGDMEINRMNKLILLRTNNIFRDRCAIDIQNDTLGILMENSKFFEIYVDDENEEEEETLVRLTPFAMKSIALWNVCAIDIIRGIDENENVDHSRTYMIYGRIYSKSNQIIRVTALKYFRLLDPKTTFVFIDPQQLTEQQISQLQPGQLILCETYRVSRLGTWCSYVTKNYRILQETDKFYRFFPMCEHEISDIEREPLPASKPEPTGLEKMRMIIDDCFVVNNTITAADLVAICAGYNYKSTDVLNFIAQQTHLYEIVNNQKSCKKRDNEQVEKLIKLVERLMENCGITTDEIEIGINEQEFLQLWPIISEKFEQYFVGEKCILQPLQRFENGLFIY